MKRILENIKIAFKSLGLNKLRSFLTMLGIIIGVGSVVAVMSVGAGAEASITENIQSMGTNVITISPGREQVFAGNREVRMEPNAEQGGGFMNRFGDNEEEEIVAGELYLEDVDALKEKAKLLNEVVPVLSGFNSTFSYMSWSGNVSVTATTEDYLSLQGYEMDKGSFFTVSDVSNSSNVAVIGDTVVSDFFGKINPVGEVIKIDGKNFKVMGTLKSIGSTFGMNPDNVIYIPITTAQNKLYGVDTVNQILVKVKSEEVMDQATEEVKAKLRIQHHILPGENNDFEIRSSAQLLEMASSVSDILVILLGSIAAISLLVGGIGIMNIMFVSVTERTREIGIRKAIGAKNRDILVQFLTESIVLSLSGGIIGVGFAGFITWILGTFTTLSSLITAFPIILALSFSTVIGLVFGILPAMRAARLNPIDSLRHE